MDLYEEKFLSNLASYTITKLVRGVLHVHVLFFRSLFPFQLSVASYDFFFRGFYESASLMDFNEHFLKSEFIVFA